MFIPFQYHQFIDYTIISEYCLLRSFQFSPFPAFPRQQATRKHPEVVSMDDICLCLVLYRFLSVSTKENEIHLFENSSDYSHAPPSFSISLFPKSSTDKKEKDRKIKRENFGCLLCLMVEDASPSSRRYVMIHLFNFKFYFIAFFFFSVFWYDSCIQDSGCGFGSKCLWVHLIFQ